MLSSVFVAATEQGATGIPHISPTPYVAPAKQPIVQQVTQLTESANHSAFSFGSYFEALAILFLVLAILWLFVAFFRRKSGTFSKSLPSMRIESRLAIAPKKWIIVAKVMDKRLVLGITDQQITMLTEISSTAPKKEDLAGEKKNSSKRVVPKSTETK